MNNDLDLVSRQAVLSVLEEIFNRYNILWKYYGFGEEVSKAIEELPTAFDKKSVINELEEQKDKAAAMYYEIQEEEKLYYAGKYVAYDDAICVVMKGGL